MLNPREGFGRDSGLRPSSDPEREVGSMSLSRGLRSDLERLSAGAEARLFLGGESLRISLPLRSLWIGSAAKSGVLPH